MTTPPALIVVGVDGTPEADAALAFAIDEAARSRDTLELVTAWDTDTTLTSLDEVYGVVMSRAEYRAQQEAERHQRAALDRVMAGRPGAIVVTARVVRGRPGPVLVDAARTARLLVVGSRSLGPVRAMIRGSVRRYCMRCSDAAVVVVPESRMSAG
jgi:nucleotide-binding universal stress UspA family protein